MSYTSWKDAYARETTFADDSTLDGAGDTGYLLGAVSEQSEHPSPTTSVNYTATGVNTKEVGVGLLFKSRFELRGMYGLRMQNGILCELAMGKSSTAASVHTITPTTDGSKLPSIVINHEEIGSATDEEYQFLGCKVDSLVLSHDMVDADFLMAKVEVMAAKAQDGVALTNDPALPATANTDSYVNLTRVWDPDTDNLSIDGLEKIEIGIVNGLAGLYAHSYDTGVYTGRWPYEFSETQRKNYFINLELHPNTIERKMWDELIATGNTRDATFKWTRSANDYILVTASDCQVISNTKVTPAVGDRQVERVIIEPRALSIDVKDSIAGGFYGE